MICLLAPRTSGETPRQDPREASLNPKPNELQIRRHSVRNPALDLRQRNGYALRWDKILVLPKLKLGPTYIRSYAAGRSR